jgi:hypothetical protein
MKIIYLTEDSIRRSIDKSVWSLLYNCGSAIVRDSVFYSIHHPVGSFVLRGPVNSSAKNLTKNLNEN